ncbi:MAG: L,D-transpeptidase family protein [Myxococcota bacterium]
MNPAGGFALALVLSSPAVDPTEPAVCLRHRVEQLGESFGPSGSEVRLRAGRRLREEYQGRNFRPLWDESTVEALLEEAQRYAEEGLRLPPEHRLRLHLLLRSKDPCAIAERDLVASDLFIILASHLSQGQVHPRRVDPDWHPPRRHTPMEGLMVQDLSPGLIREQLSALRPSAPEYGRLVQALARLKSLQPGWLAPPGPLREGQMPTAEHRRWLRERLAFEPEAQNLDPAGRDVDWTSVLTAVQARYDVPPSGQLDSPTLRALAVPLSIRILQLEVNLERLRWLDESEASEPSNSTRIEVALAAKKLRVVRPGQDDLVMPVAFGRTARRTPVLRTKLPYLVLNPTWFVPPRVAREDLLPKILEDPKYLPNNHLRTYLHGPSGLVRVKGAELDWHQIAEKRTPFRLVQAPGPKNYLGKLKFVMPDANGIYIHGNAPYRRFEPGPTSAGCIRVEDPLFLAQALLEGDSAWPAARLERILASGREIIVHLFRPVPVHVTYRTAWVDKEGRLQFREDVYQRDRIIAAAVERATQGRRRAHLTGRTLSRVEGVPNPSEQGPRR